MLKQHNKTAQQHNSVIMVHSYEKKSKHKEQKRSLPSLSITQSSAQSSCSHLPHVHEIHSAPELSSSYLTKHMQQTLSSILSSGAAAGAALLLRSLDFTSADVDADVDVDGPPNTTVLGIGAFLLLAPPALFFFSPKFCLLRTLFLNFGFLQR